MRKSIRKGVKPVTEKEFLEVVAAAKPLLDQIHLNICLCNREGKIIYVNPHAAEGIKETAGILGLEDIKTGYDVIGTHMEKWHRLRGFTKAMEERKGQWGTWYLKGERWRPRSDCIRDDNGEVIGYVGAWQELDQGPSAADKTEATYEAPEYRKVQP